MVSDIFFHDGELEGITALCDVFNLEGKFVCPLRCLASTLSCLGFSLCGTLEVDGDEGVHLSERI
jgi:hypothetical protein